MQNSTPHATAPVPATTVDESQSTYLTVVKEAKWLLNKYPTKAASQADGYGDKYDFCATIVNYLAVYEEDAGPYGVSAS